MIDATSSLFTLVCPDYYKREDAPHVVAAIAGLDDLSAAATVEVVTWLAENQAKTERN